jgi:diguanylate cyclase (GGDEF)-like protein/PAS domain S-box-containing protein
MHAEIPSAAAKRTRIESVALAIFLIVTAVLIGGFFLPDDDNSLGWFSDVSLTAVSVVGGLVTLVAARSMKGRDRLSWTLIGAGILSWGLGQAAWTYMELVLGIDRPFPSLADAGYIPMIPLMFAGLISLPGTGSRRTGRLTIGLDAFIVMACVATVSWFAVLGPIYVKADATWDEKFFGLIYPAGDVLLLFGLIGGLARGWFARRNPVVAPLMLGIGLFIAADLGFAYLTVNQTYQSGSLIDLGWPLGFLFATYAAVRRWTRGEASVRNDGPGEMPRWLESVLRLAPYPLVVGVLGLLFMSHLFQRPIDQNVYIALTLTTVILVLARQFVTLRENERLTEGLRSFSQKLETMVEERTTRLTALHELAAGLCGAASVHQVTEIGLRALCGAVGGQAAVLFLHEHGTWARAAAFPDAATNAPLPTEDVVADLMLQKVVSGSENNGAPRTTLWVPVSERGQVYGFIAVLGPHLDQDLDAQHLATIGAEFGVAFEDQRRFEAAYQNEARFRSLVQNSSDTITVIDANAIVRYHSQAAQRIFGDDPETVVGTSWIEMLHEDDRSQATALLAEVARTPGATAAAEWRRKAHGTWRFVETLATNLLDDPSVRGIVLNSRDISERKALEEQLTHQAFHDSLTTLANRALFHDRVEHALTKSRRTASPVAVLFLDLDNFKTVNDSLGHAAGDQVLVGVAGRVNASVRTGDTVARFGGDEFAILLEDVHEVSEAIEVAQRIEQALRAPFHIDGKDVFITSSTGVALSTVGASSADELLRNADVAMYTAKERGKGRHITFEPDMHAAVVRRLELEVDLRRAVEREEFLVHYQPLFDLRSGGMTGVEALVRWRHPEQGLVSPADFIPVAEDTGLIVELGRWVLRQSCRDAADWQRRFGAAAPSKVNVNLSARQLQQAGLVDDVAAALGDSGLPASNLVLEITESVLMQDAASAVGRLTELKNLGVQLAIDDFGTGYSSLSYLQQFPVDTLKIDKSFIDGVGREAERAALTSAIIDLSRTLGLKTVAEGIEEAAQATELTLLGCDVGQGYHFARPMDRERLEQTIAESANQERRAA